MLGLSNRRIMVRHIWPNVMPLALANAFLTFAFSIVALASLSFLGLGVGPGTADWGRMLSDSRTLLFDVPAAAVAPGIAIVITAASVNVIGDWLYERLSDRGRAR
jgi:peptide/nickel transport system permease protein